MALYNFLIIWELPFFFGGGIVKLFTVALQTDLDSEFPLPGQGAPNTLVQ